MFSSDAVALGSASADVVRIAIADSRPIVRAGLRQLLEAEPRYRIVGEMGSGLDAAVALVELHSDVLLLEFSSASLATLQRIASSPTPIRIILLAESVSRRDLNEALQLGARGLVLKDSAADVVFDAIKTVLAGQFWIGSAAAPDIATGLRQLASELRRRQQFGLTTRELDIVRMVVAGHTNKEIADGLSIGENTVKSHLTHIFNKLGASNRIELALFAAHHRLLDGE
jgi:two-component system, NarL family, nitrate/nitrite response regulator NarL